VPPRVRLHELGMRREMREQRVAVLREPEEMVLLLDPVDGAVERALAVDEILLLLERLAADAVPALVEPLVDVPLRRDPAYELLHRGLMAGVGGGGCDVVEGVQDGPP